MKTYLLCILVGTTLLIGGCFGPLADIKLPDLPNLHDAKSYFAGDIFADFYYDQTGGVNIAVDPELVVTTGPPQIYQGSSEQCDVMAMVQKGYVLLGYSFFQADDIDINSAILQAQSVKASIVLLYSKTADAVAELPSFPYAIEDEEKAAGGSCSFPVQTYGDRTTHVPQRLTPQDCLATFWIKRQGLLLGLYVKTLSDETESAIKKGVVVDMVVEGSPASKAGIKRGDLLIKIGQTDILEINDFSEAVSQYAGQPTMIIIYRDGERLSAKVNIKEKRVIEYPTQ